MDEVTEVVIIRDEGNVVIDAGLGDEAIGEFGLEAAALQISAKHSGSPPVPGVKLEERQGGDHRQSGVSDPRVAEKFG